MRNDKNIDKVIQDYVNWYGRRHLNAVLNPLKDEYNKTEIDVMSDKISIYFIELVNNDYILHGANFDIIISNITDPARLYITFIYRKFTQFKFIDSNMYDNDIGYRYKFQIFYIKTNKMVVEFDINKHSEYGEYDGMYGVYNYNTFNNGIHYIRCMCGFCGETFQKQISYLCHNIDNINYNTHKTTIKNITKPKWYCKIIRVKEPEIKRKIIPPISLKPKTISVDEYEYLKQFLYKD